MKVFLVLGVLCVPNVECIWFTEPEPKKYYNLKKCITAATELGNKMYREMTEQGIPVRLKTWCRGVEYHGENS